jgi:hypothetical protein
MFVFPAHEISVRKPDYSESSPSRERGVQNLTYYRTEKTVSWSLPTEGTAIPLQFRAEIHKRQTPGPHPDGYSGRSLKKSLIVNHPVEGIGDSPLLWNVQIPDDCSFPETLSEVLLIITFFDDGSSSFTIIEDIFKADDIELRIESTIEELDRLRLELRNLRRSEN